MGFFDRVRETLRDRTRENFCEGLQRLGIHAQMAERGCAEENIGLGGPLTSRNYTKSLGVIDISEGPIHWVNVLKKREPGKGGGSIVYYAEYAVPDTRLGPNSPRLRIKSVSVKTFPLVGKVVDLNWKGIDFGLRFIGRMNSDLGWKLIERLNSDPELKEPIIKSRKVTIGGSVIIRARCDHCCWIIATEIHSAPSIELWNCYQSIAQHLLAE